MSYLTRRSVRQEGVIGTTKRHSRRDVPKRRRGRSINKRSQERLMELLHRVFDLIEVLIKKLLS